jgi:predicted signal transduction protein with EAL and GGDEF domain
MLLEVARRLKGCVREEDTVARLGGDEFVVLLGNLSANHAEASAESLRIAEKIKRELGSPYPLDGKKHHSSPSIGITLYCDNTFSVDELLKNADSAMYEAKKSGRNAIRFFDPSTQAALIARGELERELYEATENHQFELYYQVQVNEDYSVLGAEVLLRWLHPEKGMISPNQFIPVTEETGLILPIGEWVLEEVCRQLKRWHAIPIFEDIILAVNVSIRQLREADFVPRLRAVIERTGINPTRLKLEITESMLMNDTQSMIEIMQALKSDGVKFSLDDFGTGYSSLSYIKQLPLDQIKIDQSFVRDLSHDVNSRSLVRTIISMAESMKVEVIAEGVETESQRQTLAIEGCMTWQGYLFGKPLPLMEFEKLARMLRENAC